MAILDVTKDSPYYPSAAALEVTLRCNMKCLHCGSSAGSKARRNELSLAEWKDVVDQLVGLNAEYIVLSGGEPLLWKDWRELARHIRGKDRKCGIISNGYLFSKDDAKFLKGIGINRFGVSVDGMEDAHNKIRNMKDSFKKVSSTIALCREEDIHVGVVTSVNKINYDDLDRLYVFLKDLGVGNWQIQITNAFGRAGEDEKSLLISKGQYVKLIEKIAEFQKRSEQEGSSMQVVPADSIGYCYGVAEEVWGDLEWCGCNAGRYVIGIKSNGDVTGCLSLQDEYFVVGNVRKKTLSEIWYDEESFAYSRKLQKGDLKGCCADCEHGDSCRSGCLSVGYSLTKEIGHNPYCYYGILVKNR